jgi:hypothetical protein
MGIDEIALMDNMTSLSIAGSVLLFISIAYVSVSKLKHLPSNPLVPATAQHYGRYRHVC